MDCGIEILYSGELVSSVVRQHWNLFSTERKRKVVRQDETAGKSRCTSPAPRN